MATKLTTEQSSKYLQQLSDIKTTLEKLSANNQKSIKPAPAGQVLGASTTQPTQSLRELSIANSPQNQITQDQASKLTTKDLSKKLAVQYYGNADSAKKAFDETKKQYQLEQRTNQTTFNFNPETLKRTQREVDKLGFSLDELDNNPFEPKQFKDEERKNTLEVSSREMAKMFDSPAQLYDAYQFNVPMKNTLDNFIKKGGNLESISKNISSPVTQNDTFQNGSGVYQTNPDGTAHLVSGSGEATLSSPNQQTSSEYLANLRNPAANQQAQQKALDELAPESQIAQDEVARLGRIPDGLKRLYFGDEKSIGILGMKINQAKEEARIISEKEKDSKNTARSRSELAIDKNRAEAVQYKNEIEQNRLKAKNYMTGYLAKLGALNTTGAAAEALTTLDANYNGQAVQIDSRYSFANRALELDLTEQLDQIENDSSTKVLKIQEDLTLDTEKMMKEVLKTQQDSEKETYTVTEQYARRLREQTTSYTKELKAAAEKYAKEYARKAGLNTGGFTSDGKPTKNNFIISDIENKFNASRHKVEDGGDGHVNSAVYKAQAQRWIASGGTINTFKNTFPTANYVNPTDPTLPPELRYAKASQTIQQNNVQSQIDDWLNSQTIPSAG